MKLRKRHFNLATRDAHLNPELLRQVASAGSSQAYDLCVKEIEDLGWQLWPVDRPHDWRFNMTLRRRILLAPSWKKRSTYSKVRVLAHEPVHCRQRLAKGHARFLGQYFTSARMRWAMETNAYRADVYLTPDRDLEALAKWMRKAYLLGSIPERQYTVETLAIWREAAEGGIS